jgi:hypothetical protein
MGQRPPPGKCVHCLEHFEELTWDHVFPAAWYPDTTPEEMEKWQVPACLACNREYGKLEDELLWRLGLCIDPATAAASGIAEKALRSIRPECARDEKDRQAREARRAKLVRELEFTKGLAPGGYFPNFGPEGGKLLPGMLRVLISAEQLIRLGEKIVRGLTYILDGTFVMPERAVQIYFVENEQAADVIALIKKNGSRHHRGPGIAAERAIPVDDTALALFMIDIWARVRIFGSILPAGSNLEIAT